MQKPDLYTTLNYLADAVHEYNCLLKRVVKQMTIEQEDSNRTIAEVMSETKLSYSTIRRSLPNMPWFKIGRKWYIKDTALKEGIRTGAFNKFKL